MGEGAPKVFFINERESLASEKLLQERIKIKLRSFKSNELNEESDGPYRGFGYSSLFSDPLDLAT